MFACPSVVVVPDVVVVTTGAEVVVIGVVVVVAIDVVAAGSDGLHETREDTKSAVAAARRIRHSTAAGRQRQGW